MIQARRGNSFLQHITCISLRILKLITLTSEQLKLMKEETDQSRNQV